MTNALFNNELRELDRDMKRSIFKLFFLKEPYNRQDNRSFCRKLSIRQYIKLCIHVLTA